LASLGKDSYWSRTTGLMGIVLAIWFVIGIFIHFFAADLNATTFLGFPLGYFIAAKGSVIGFAVLIFWYCQRQDNIDRAFGVSEDS
jgi:putative solute:sodium symporter small subunit